MDFLKTNLSRANSYIRGQNDPQEEEASFMNELDKEMSMSYKNRLILFITCLGLGILLCFLATWSILSPRKFAKFYTLGTVLLLASTAFLVGPKQQLKSMFHPSRLTAALIYLFSVVITLYSAIGLQNTLLTVLMIIIQSCAALWYGASYIPFAQTVLKRTAQTVLPL